MTGEKTLSHGWRRWVAENVMLGLSPEQIENEAAAAGIERALVRAEIEEARIDPYIEAGSWIAQRLRKLESLQQVRVEVARQNAAPEAVESRRQLPASEFREHFYARNRP